MGDFRRLKVWQQAFRLTIDVYRVTAAFPSGERFGLTAQTRRAAVSVAANIAEGSGRSTRADFRRFMVIARGSLHELQCEMLVARALGYLGSADWEAFDALADGISRMLLALSNPRLPERLATHDAQPKAYC